MTAGRKRYQFNPRLSDEAKELVARIAAHHGVSKAAALEVCLRDYARRHLPPIPDAPPTDDACIPG